MVAVDESDDSLASVTWVLENLWRQGDIMHLLHVIPALPAHMTYSMAPDGMLYSLPLPEIAEAAVSGQGRLYRLHVWGEKGRERYSLPLPQIGEAVVCGQERM